jgi:hypothetical protein
VEQGRDRGRDAGIGLAGERAEDGLPLGGASRAEPRARFLGRQQDTTLSAAATRSAKIFGVTNRAFLPARSDSVTPRAPEQRPQT